MSSVPALTGPTTSHTTMIAAGHGYVNVVKTVSASASIKKANVEGPGSGQLSQVSGDVDTRLLAVLEALKGLETSVTPWSISKNAKKAKKVGEDDQVGEMIKCEQVAIKKLLGDMAKDTRAAADETSRTLRELAVKTLELDQAQETNLLLEARSAELDQIQATDMVGKVQRLQQQVEAMLGDNEALLESNAALEREKADSQRKTKETAEKMKAELEFRDRDIRRLQAELKKESKKDDLRTSKDLASDESQNQSHAEQLKAMQRRCDLAKTEAEAAKSTQNAVKSKLQQANQMLEKNQEEISTLNRKLMDTRLEKERLAQEMTLSLKELSMFHDSYSSKSDAVATQGKYFNKELAWPRVVYSTRGSKILHSSVCSSVEASRCTPMEYHSHKELELVMTSNGMLLCHSCRSEARF
eukprot:gene16923-23191_t